MARRPRIQFEGAFYHIIVRGNQRQDIFSDDGDRHRYLERLRIYKGKCGFFLYAYVLMSNHVHLLIETPADPISRIMQMINFTYTRYFNRKYGKVGHLFQGRYKSYLCDKESYLLSLVRYIHYNPVRAGIVKDVGAYQWSSHGDYVQRSRGLVDTDKVLSLFSERPGIAVRKYTEFMNADESGKDITLYSAHEQQIVGDDSFVEEVQKRIGGIERKAKKLPIGDLVSAIEKETGVGMKDMVSRRRDEALRRARGVFVALAREIGYSLTDLQKELNRDVSVLSRLATIGESAEGEKLLRKARKGLMAQKQGGTIG